MQIITAILYYLVRENSFQSLLGAHGEFIFIVSEAKARGAAHHSAAEEMVISLIFIRPPYLEPRQPVCFGIVYILV